MPMHANTARPAFERGTLIGVATTLAVWLGGVLALAAAGAFAGSPTRPPLGILLAVVLPPLILAVLYRLLARFRAFALAVDLRWLTAIQAWRVVGMMFLVLYAFGLLPGLFAWPAGLGDAAVGLAAPFVLTAILQATPTWPRRVFWLNIAGLIDFAGALGTGVLTSDSAIGFLADGLPHADLGALPLCLVPAFAVPLWIVFHMASLLQLRQMRGASGATSV